MEDLKFDNVEDWILSTAGDVVECEAKKCCVVYVADDNVVRMSHFGYDIDRSTDSAALCFPALALLIDKSKSKWDMTKRLWKLICGFVDSAFFWYGKTKGR